VVKCVVNVDAKRTLIRRQKMRHESEDYFSADRLFALPNEQRRNARILPLDKLRVKMKTLEVTSNGSVDVCLGLVLDG
jgi:hypothetical protein